MLASVSDDFEAPQTMAKKRLKGASLSISSPAPTLPMFALFTSPPVPYISFRIHQDRALHRGALTSGQGTQPHHHANANTASHLLGNLPPAMASCSPPLLRPPLPSPLPHTYTHARHSTDGESAGFLRQEAERAARPQQKMLAVTLDCLVLSAGMVPTPNPGAASIPAGWQTPAAASPAPQAQHPQPAGPTDLPRGPPLGPWAHEWPPHSGHGFGKLLTCCPRGEGPMLWGRQPRGAALPSGELWAAIALQSGQAPPPRVLSADMEITQVGDKI